MKGKLPIYVKKPRSIMALGLGIYANKHEDVKHTDTVWKQG
jgi:hypothetical protein